MLERIESFKCSDGWVFEDLKEARDHEAGVQFGYLLDADDDYYHGVLNVDDGHQLRDFLKRNESEIRRYMEWEAEE